MFSLPNFGNALLFGPIGLAEQQALGLNSNLQRFTEITRADATLRGDDFLVSPKSLINTISPIAQSFTPKNTSTTLLPQIFSTNPLNTQTFPNANDLLSRSSDALNNILSASFGNNLQVPLAFQPGPSGIPIVDLGSNPEPLKILGAVNAAPLSNVQADLQRFGFPLGISPNSRPFGVVNFSGVNPFVFQFNSAQAFGSPILFPGSNTNQFTAGTARDFTPLLQQFQPPGTLPFIRV